MKIDTFPRIRVRSLPLAACLVAALAASHADGSSVQRAPRAARPAFDAPQEPNVLPVSSCLDDGGPGTLRSVVASAADGDTIDMSQLACGTITLANGAIPIGVADLTLQGPGANLLTIDGAYADRVLTHNTPGTLTINDVTIAHGHYATGTSLGGCIYSKGSTNLNRTTVSSCSTAGGEFIFAGGGALVAYGDLTLVDSTLSDNLAVRASAGSYFVVGGAAVVSGNATIFNSTLSGNTVQGLAGTYGYHAYGGGIVVNGTLTVRNSTIAFNAAGRGGGGIFSLGYGIELDSSIVADNQSTYAGYFSADIGGYGTLTGANNLVVASDIIVPVGTLNSDPQLLPLADNGGPTRTHALSPTSPAIDTGNNAMSLPFDQRGEGFLRVSGLVADIGAFEYQQAFAVPTVSKNFAPDTIVAGDLSTLTITLANANAADATLTADLVDNLPGAVVVASAPGTATTCPNGSVVADAGSSAVTLAAGAAIPADGACTITVSVTSISAGTFTNTIPGGALQTDQGTDPGSASADLAVTAQTPAVAKSFSPGSMPADGTSTLTITLTNGNAVAATLSADLDDNLPPSLAVGESPNAVTTCSGGTVVADPGTGTVTLAAGAQIPANASCLVAVAVAASLPGVFTNTIPSGALQTTLGSSAEAASADLTVTSADRIFTDGFDGAAAVPAVDRLPETVE